MDSRMMLNVQRIYNVTVSLAISQRSHCQLCSYLNELELAPALKQEAHHRTRDQTSAQTVHSQLPCILLFPRPRIHPHHQEHDIRAARDVQNLEYEIPPAPPWRHPKEIEISRSEDQDVEELSQEGDALGGLVVVDGPYEDALGGRVRYVALEVGQRKRLIKASTPGSSNNYAKYVHVER